MFTELNINKLPMRNVLYECLDDLNNWGLISIISDVDFRSINKNTTVVIDRIIYDDNYTILYADEINKILYCEGDVRFKKTLLYIYVVIASWIGINGRMYCFPTREQLKADLQTTSNKRITDAIYKLKKLALIDFANVGVIRNDSRIYQANNVYVLTTHPHYKDVLDQALEDSKFYYETLQ